VPAAVKSVPSTVWAEVFLKGEIQNYTNNETEISIFRHKQDVYQSWKTSEPRICLGFWKEGSEIWKLQNFHNNTQCMFKQEAMMTKNCSSQNEFGRWSILIKKINFLTFVEYCSVLLACSVVIEVLSEIALRKWKLSLIYIYKYIFQHYVPSYSTTLKGHQLGRGIGIKWIWRSKWTGGSIVCL